MSETSICTGDDLRNPLTAILIRSVVEGGGLGFDARQHANKKNNKIKHTNICTGDDLRNPRNATLIRSAVPGDAMVLTPDGRQPIKNNIRR